MKRALPILGLLLAAAAFLTFAPGTAIADEEVLVADGPPSTVTGWSGIDVDTCIRELQLTLGPHDDRPSRFPNEVVTFVIGNPHGLPQSVLDAVRAGVLSWNRVGAPFILVESVTSVWDIAIVPVAGVDLASGAIGSAGVACNPLVGSLAATVFVATGGRTAIFISNVTRHEMGHALGINHSNEPGDLMFPVAPSNVSTAILCPSNLDVEALGVETVEHRLPRPVFAVRAAC